MLLSFSRENVKKKEGVFMGLFKSEEEKAAKAEEKVQKLMAKYHLEEVSPEYAEAVREISLEMAGNGLMDLGITLSGKSEDVAKISCLRAIYEQNWIIIRLLDKIANK